MDEKITARPIDENTVKQLIDRAIRAKGNAYVPYSHFSVGAAVLGADGKIYSGCNIENASYGLTVCAERTAIFKMVSEGCTEFVAMAVLAGQEPSDSMSCGACRQVMSEFCRPDTPIINGSVSGKYFILPFADIYPYPFTKFTPNE